VHSDRHLHPVLLQPDPHPELVDGSLRRALGVRAGRAQVSTRIRLADSQKIVAIAKMSDGSFWSSTADVVVTLAACTEEVP